MNVGTKSVLFGAHQFIVHPFFVLTAWLIIYRKFPLPHELAAIMTHDLGYFGSPNMDGKEGEDHPERAARWWRTKFGGFGLKVADVILGHSRFHAAKNGLPLSRLFQPDKMATSLYPIWLYLLLANLSGEIKEYMAHAKNGKYCDVLKEGHSQVHWVIEMQAHMALIGLQGGQYAPVAAQMERDSKELPSERA